MSPMPGGQMPKPSEPARDAFRTLVPDDPAVATRPMFGNLAGFVNGNMFTGLYGSDLFVRLPDAEQEQVRALGGSAFEPMAGRPMKGYVTLPGTWIDDRPLAAEWVARALVWARGLPDKEPARRKR